MENEKLKMNTKKCNPYAGASNYHTQDSDKAKFVWAHERVRVTQALGRALWEYERQVGCGFVQLCPHKVAPSGGH